MVTKVRDCNWEQFKNRFSGDEAVHVIETLSVLDSDDLNDQIEREQIIRIPQKWRDGFETARQKVARRNAPQQDMAGKNLHIERVRINSPYVRSFLAAATGEAALVEKPHVLLRPFRLLVHFHEELEQEFQLLEKKLAANPESTLAGHPISAQDILDHNTHQPSSILDREDQPNLTSRASDNLKRAYQTGGESESDRIALDHIKCYMEFARVKLFAPFHSFSKLDFSNRPRIRYEELWSLFHIGELAFECLDLNDIPATEGPKTDNPRPGPSQQQGIPRLWRICSISPEQVDWVVLNPQHPNQLRRIAAKGNPDLRLFVVRAYRLDWDGDSESFSPEDDNFEIERFESQKEVSRLLLYPVRFHPDFKVILERLRARGHQFQKFLIDSHLAMDYDGWTLSVDPNGCPIRDDERKIQGPEYISSDVIIDFKEAVCAHPSWEPCFTEYGFQLTWWADKERSVMLDQSPDIVVVDDAITSVQWADLAKTDDFLFDHSVRPTEKMGAKKNLTSDDQALLPERLFAYSLKDRKFINANITCMRKPKVIRDPFRELRIPEDHKHLIRATVQDHSERKRVERLLDGQGLESLEQDFIRHKGKGLTFLLHGAPGTGKTATAEAVASSHSKPLYFTWVRTVESSLSEIFRLANLWDCVLLLDEADIFLSHREKTDDNLQRNALVSIFLRTMEYYPGILFLTTNRAGALDEALSSRVHVSINFPDLNREQTMALFRMNIKRSRKIAEQRAKIAGQPTLLIRQKEIVEFAGDEFGNMARVTSPWWNGRLIRNAFQVAMSLAYVESKNDYRDHRTSQDAADSTTTRVVTKCLGREHFDQVLEVFDDFRLYRESLFKAPDWELAFTKEERWAGETHQSRNEKYSPAHGLSRSNQQGSSGTPRHQSGRRQPSSSQAYQKTLAEPRGTPTPQRNRKTPPPRRSQLTPVRYINASSGGGRSLTLSMNAQYDDEDEDGRDEDEQEEDEEDEDEFDSNY
ncbi:hypothetical protein V8F33_013739 [Rhypophila sp. PSN 637]